MPRRPRQASEAYSDKPQGPSLTAMKTACQKRSPLKQRLTVLARGRARTPRFRLMTACKRMAPGKVRSWRKTSIARCAHLGVSGQLWTPDSSRGKILTPLVEMNNSKSVGSVYSPVNDRGITTRLNSKGVVLSYPCVQGDHVPGIRGVGILPGGGTQTGSPDQESISLGVSNERSRRMQAAWGTNILIGKPSG